MTNKAETINQENVMLPEHFSGAQREDYLLAVDLAYIANEAFNTRAEMARRILSETSNPPYENNTSPLPSTKGRFSAAEADFTMYNNAASVLMPPRKAFTPLENDDSVFGEGQFASEHAFNLMSPEQKILALKVRGAIIEKFSAYGVTVENLPVVMAEGSKGEATFSVVYSGNGIDIGDKSKDYDKARSYNSVMSKKNDRLFVIELDGVKYDTRKGMTSAVYEAMIADAKENQRDKPLPDSKQASEEAKDLWAWTMLTGEPLTADGLVRIRGVVGGEVHRGVNLPDYDDRFLRVRPAVEIK